MKTNNEEKREKVWREFWEEIYPTIEKYDKKLNVEETPNTNLVDNSNKLVVPCLSDKINIHITEECVYVKDLKQAIKRVLERLEKHFYSSTGFYPVHEIIEERMGKELCE